MDDYDRIDERLAEVRRRELLDEMMRGWLYGIPMISREEYAKFFAVTSDAQKAKDKLAVERLIASLKEKP